LASTVGEVNILRLWLDMKSRGRSVRQERADWREGCMLFEKFYFSSPSSRMVTTSKRKVLINL
jgi:hypothetical protein